ncbi:MAG: diguanylate cyclase [Candidatus Azotimanducaceae bacterium]|jgi:diguanylate cyclase
MCSVLAQAMPEVTINSGVDSLNLGSSIEYYIDPTGNLTVEDVQTLEDVLWQKNTNATITLGFTDSVYWFRTRITNNSKDTAFLLHAGYPRFDQIDTYQLVDNNFIHHGMGIGVPTSEKLISHREHLVSVEIRSNGVTTLFIRAKTTGSFLLPLRLWRAIAFFQSDSLKNLWSGALLGVWLIVMIFNLVIFSALNHSSIISFVSFTLFFGVYQFSAMGLGRQYWGKSIESYDAILIFSIGSAIISIYFFLTELLQLKQTSKLGEMVLRITAGAAICCMLGYIIFDYATVIPYLAALTILMSTLVVIIGAQAALKGSRLALYSTIAWAILGAGIITQALISLDLMVANFLTEQAGPIAFIIMIISVSFAIAAELRQQRQKQQELDRDQYQLERTQQLAQNKELEGRVHERTEELETALQELSAAHETLKELNTVDAMTGIKNRTYFDSTFEQEWRRAIRQHYPLSLMLLDIDHFKKVNDTYGHLVGDQCLREIAMLIKSVLRRPADILARYGGEEFVVLLPYVESDNAVFLAEQIRAKIANTQLKIDGHLLNITLSIGVSTKYPREADDRKDFIQASDVALYRAKDNGRNNIQVTKDSAADGAIDTPIETLL